MRRFLGRNALPWVLLAVAVIELAAGRGLPGRFFSHEVDEILYAVDHERFDAEVVLLGDSIAYSFADGWDDLGESFAVMPANQALETAGQYFLIERYLGANEKPRAVVYIGGDPFGRNLGQVYTENYVQRCFTRWHEIAALAGARGNPVFAFKMVLYRLLPTMKYRLHLQDRIWGRTNGDIYTGKGGVERRGGGPSGASLTAIMQKQMLERRDEPVSDEYFLRIISLLEERGIDFHYVPAPVSERTFAWERTRRLRDLRRRMKHIAREHGNFFPRPDLQLVYPEAYFRDGSHFGEPYRSEVREDLRPYLQLSDPVFFPVRREGQGE